MHSGGEAELAPGAAGRVCVVELGAETRVGIFVPESGAQRLLTVAGAPSTLDAPDFDLTLSYERAIAEAEARAGMFGFPEPPSRQGDITRRPPVFAVTGRGLTSGPSCFFVGSLVPRDLETLEQAITDRGFTLTGRAATAVHTFRDRIDGPATIDVIAAQRPDVVIVALAEDPEGQGLAYMADLLVGGLAGREPGYVPVITVFVGGALDERAVMTLEQAFTVHAASVQGGMPDVPLDMSVPGSLLDRVAQTVSDRRFSGRTVPESIAVAPVRSTSAALEVAARALATQQSLDVAVVLLDDDQVVIAGHQNGTSTSIGTGRRTDAMRAYHVGLQTPVERVAQWAPEAPLPQAIRRMVLNRSAHPTTVAATPAELQLAHAVWIAAARQVLRESEDGRSPIDQDMLDLVVLTGRAAETVGRPVQAALLLVNVLEPVGVTQLALDPASSLAMQGALASSGVQVGIDSALVPLGVCVAPRGRATPGEPAVLVEVRPSSGSRVEREVNAGTLDVIQWDARVPAEIRIWPQPRFDIGLGNGRPAQLKVNVEAGLVGIIVDARGRPLAWPDEQQERQARLQQWLRSTDAFPVLTPTVSSSDV